MKNCILLTIFGFLPMALFGSILTVSSTSDSGFGTLRQAVLSASASDTINFSSSTNGTPILLTSGEITLNKRLTIIGNGMGVTLIDGSSSSRIFFVDNSGTNSDTLNISMLTVQNGSATVHGGGIGSFGNAPHNSYVLNLSNVEIKNCTAGFSGGGLAIGIGTLDQCYIHNNSDGGSGGGMYAHWHPVNITNTTVANNAGLYIGGASFNGVSNLTNCTFYGNVATDTLQGKGGLHVTGEITNCTVTKNTGAQNGGLSHSGFSSVNIVNSIIYGNTGGDVLIISFSFPPSDNASYSNNIVDSCHVQSFSTINCPSWYSTQDPLLDPLGLQNNGGATQTVAIDCGSPAIDAGISTTQVLSTDQRGVARIGAPDIGAYENGATIDTTVSVSGIMLIANSNTTYQWIDCDNGNSLISGATSQFFIPSVSGNYAVIVGDGAGCVDTSACYLVTNIGLNELGLSKVLALYPNPNSGDFSIDLGSVHSNVEVHIVDIAGREIESLYFNKKKLIQISVKRLMGLYYISIHTDSDKAVIPLLIE